MTQFEVHPVPPAAEHPQNVPALARVHRTIGSICAFRVQGQRGRCHNPQRRSRSVIMPAVRRSSSRLCCGSHGRPPLCPSEWERRPESEKSWAHRAHSEASTRQRRTVNVESRSHVRAQFDPGSPDEIAQRSERAHKDARKRHVARERQQVRRRRRGRPSLETTRSGRGGRWTDRLAVRVGRLFDQSSVRRSRSCCFVAPPRLAVHIPTEETKWQQEP